MFLFIVWTLCARWASSSNLTQEKWSERHEKKWQNRIANTTKTIKQLTKRKCKTPKHEWTKEKNWSKSTTFDRLSWYSFFSVARLPLRDFFIIFFPPFAVVISFTFLLSFLHFLWHFFYSHFFGKIVFFVSWLWFLSRRTRSVGFECTQFYRELLSFRFAAIAFFSAFFRLRFFFVIVSFAWYFDVFSLLKFGVDVSHGRILFRTSSLLNLICCRIFFEVSFGSFFALLSENAKMKRKITRNELFDFRAQSSRVEVARFVSRLPSWANNYGEITIRWQFSCEIEREWKHMRQLKLIFCNDFYFNFASRSNAFFCLLSRLTVYQQIVNCTTNFITLTRVSSDFAAVSSVWLRYHSRHISENKNSNNFRRFSPISLLIFKRDMENEFPLCCQCRSCFVALFFFVCNALVHRIHAYLQFTLPTRRMSSEI